MARIVQFDPRWKEIGVSVVRWCWIILHYCRCARWQTFRDKTIGYTQVRSGSSHFLRSVHARDMVLYTGSSGYGPSLTKLSDNVLVIEVSTDEKYSFLYFCFSCLPCLGTHACCLGKILRLSISWMLTAWLRLIRIQWSFCHFWYFGEHDL